MIHGGLEATPNSVLRDVIFVPKSATVGIVTPWEPANSTHKVVCTRVTLEDEALTGYWRARWRTGF